MLRKPRYFRSHPSRLAPGRRAQVPGASPARGRCRSPAGAPGHGACHQPGDGLAPQPFGRVAGPDEQGHRPVVDTRTITRRGHTARCLGRPDSKVPHDSALKNASGSPPTHSPPFQPLSRSNFSTNTPFASSFQPPDMWVNLLIRERCGKVDCAFGLSTLRPGFRTVGWVSASLLHRSFCVLVTDSLSPRSCPA